jgi:DNA-directed RNA polymerase subunit RPC12/RpoP
MKSKKVLKRYQELLKHMEYYNIMAPFPIYDTSYVNEIKNKIKEIMSDKLKEYDNEPVVACKYCKSLHIKIDEDDNNICMRCGSINELKDFENIYKYNEWLKKKDE